MEKFFEEQFKMLSRGIVATPNSREDLEHLLKPIKVQWIFY